MNFDVTIMMRDSSLTRGVEWLSGVPLA